MATETKLMSSVRCPRGHYVALGGRIPQASETMELTCRCKSAAGYGGWSQGQKQQTGEHKATFHIKFPFSDLRVSTPSAATAGRPERREQACRA
jgi:hypothetical protein